MVEKQLERGEYEEKVEEWNVQTALVNFIGSEG